MVAMNSTVPSWKLMIVAMVFVVNRIQAVSKCPMFAITRTIVMTKVMKIIVKW